MTTSCYREMETTVTRFENIQPRVTITMQARFGAKFLVSQGMLMPLTPCCGAVAKGLDGYIGCRNCYDEVDPIYGDCEFINAPNARRIVDEIAAEYGMTDLDKIVPCVVECLRAEWDRQNAMLADHH